MMTANRRSSAASVYSAALTEAKQSGATREYFRLLQQAAKAGNVRALSDLGEWLLEGCEDRAGVVLRRSPRRAVGLLVRAADAKDTMALIALGNCLADGIGIPRDPLAAEKCFRVGARAGSAAAALNLAAVLRARRHYANERRWLKRAAALGDLLAPLLLAEIDLAGARRDAAERAAKFLRKRAQSRRDVVREEAREILAHFERSGRRRWVVEPSVEQRHVRRS
jgi:hypothetical protein